jgi:hypothetical protein
MTASIEINGMFFSGKFDPSNSNAVATLVGTGSDLLHCVLHFDTGRAEARRQGRSGSPRDSSGVPRRRLP